jgi:hypothetical protein
MRYEKCIRKLGLKGRVQLGRNRIRWKDNIKTDLNETGIRRLWTGFVWLRIGIRGGLP